MNHEKSSHTDSHNFEVVGNGRRNDDFRERHSRGKKATFAAAAVLLIYFLLWFPKDGNDLIETRIGCEKAKLSEENVGEQMIYDFNDFSQSGDTLNRFQITPSEKLQWHPCFDTAKCARLTVPMDYNRPLNASKDNPKVHLALSMIPGTGHNETGNYSSSPLLTNPGGPGGPGAFFVLQAGHALQGAISTDRSQDILGFDPRGVGATTPQADCWSYPSDGNETTSEDEKVGAYNYLTWVLTGMEVPLVNASSNALAQRDSRARAAAKLCKRHDDMDGENSILRHVSTPAVARDMLSIIDAWDEWRQETGQVGHHMEGQTNDQKKSEKIYDLDTRSKLLYLGFSYGTLLGATFAAMFPQRVGRVLLDGVVDADYYVAPMWSGSLQDTDRVEESFYHYCLEAGPPCKLYRAGDTEDDIRLRVQGILHALKEQPFSGVSPYSIIPFTFDYSALKWRMFAGLYFPIFAFPIFAKLLDAFHRQDEAQILSYLPAFYPSYKPFCSAGNPYRLHGGDAQLAIMCSDKRYPLNETIPNLEKSFEVLANISRYADVWMGAMIGCDSYDITPTDPPMRWDDHPAHRQTPITTSFPLMFLSNSADPVTPLFAGVKMARKFVDAGLLEQRSEGHCSLSAVSRCTVDAIRAYFEKGKVPARPSWGPEGEEVEKGVWDRCEADEWPWAPFNGTAVMRDFKASLGGLDNEEDITVDVQAALGEEMKAVQRMEDWAWVQGIASTILRPRELTGGLRVELR